MESQPPVQVRLSPSRIHAEIDRRIHDAQQMPLNPLIEGEYFIWMSLMVLFAEYLSPVAALKDRDTAHPLSYYEELIQNSTRDQICQTLRTILGPCALQDAHSFGLTKEQAEQQVAKTVERMAAFVTPEALVLRLRYIFLIHQQAAADTVKMLNNLNQILGHTGPGDINQNPNLN